MVMMAYWAGQEGYKEAICRNRTETEDGLYIPCDHSAGPGLSGQGLLSNIHHNRLPSGCVVGGYARMLRAVIRPYSMFLLL
jgi:hypothetical protein